MHYKYFEQDDPDLFLTKIKYIVYDAMVQLNKTVKLIPNRPRVRITNATKNHYLDALTKHLNKVDSFLKGLNGIISDNLLSTFDEDELEVRVKCILISFISFIRGTGEYSIADFRAHHIVNGNSHEFRRVLGWALGSYK